MLRKRGALVPMEGLPNLTPTDTREIIYTILNSSQRQRLETDWQLDFAYSVPGQRPLPRQRLLPARHARRRLPPDPDRDGADREARPAAGHPRASPRSRAASCSSTGPTGSGKSTTLASIINEINETRDDHILTIEDPIEFLHSHKQLHRQPARDRAPTRQSFAMGLKAALRQDPDVILVGEMRDMETIGTALTAAETGHLVFATLHTQDAPQTVDRIIDVFPPDQQGQIRAQLAIGLQGIVTQTLAADRRRQRPLRRGRGARAHPGRAQPDPRGQDAPDLLADPDRRPARHADDGRLAGRPRARRPDHDGRRRDRAPASRPSCAAWSRTPTTCRSPVAA